MKESKSANENNQEIVPFELESEDENIQTMLRALPNSNKFSSNMMKTSGALMNKKNSLKLEQESSDKASILGVPNGLLDGDGIRINDNIYDLSPEIFKALSYR